jgi:HAD superfamily hydrolase (TIGR01509 family)
MSPSPPSLAAVLWDMDGTLVDTEPYWIESEHEVVREHGNGAWSEAHGHALVGMDLRDAARYMKRHGAVRLGVDETVEALLDGVVVRVRRRIPWRPGARELLQALGDEGIPCGLVTMSWRRFVDAILPALPEGVFGAVVTGDDVVRGKPHPEPYLEGAARLGLPPAACLALEDSPTGARSAWTAGCVVVAVPHLVPVPPEVRHHELPTLEGVGAQQLVALHREAGGTEERSPRLNLGR